MSAFVVSILPFVLLLVGYGFLAAFCVVVIRYLWGR